MKKWAENNVSFVFLIFCFLGLILPGMDAFPAVTTIVIIATVIFLACFKIPFHAMPAISWPQILFFYSARFIIFPIFLYLCAAKFFPAVAVAVFLFALLPPATSSPAMSHLFKGNVSLSFVLLILANLLVPIMLPLMIVLILKKSVAINAHTLCLTLLLSIVLPFVIFLGLRRNKTLIQFSKQHGSFSSILLIGATITIATAKRKALILHSPEILLEFLVIISIEMFLFYFLGLLLTKKSSTDDKISYALGSGSNNISLGISIALLYFPPGITMFLIAAQLPWILAFIPFKRWVTKQHLEQKQIDSNLKNCMHESAECQ